MPTLLARSAAGALLALLATLPASAQTFPGLRVGQSVQSALGDDDPSFVARGRFKAYRFDATAGQTYVLRLRSAEFATHLSIAWSVGGLTEELAASDDGGDPHDSRLRWRAPAAGSYIVVAQALSAEGRGGFTLSAERAPQATTAAPVPIRPGETARGALAETDAVDEADDTFFDSFTLQGTRGQRLRIEMRSDSFDTFLAFGRGSQSSWVVSDTDDDGLGEGTHSRLLVTLPEDGEFVIRANSVGSGATGPYTLSVTERAQPAPPVAQPLPPGEEVAASLDDGDPETADGSLYDLYRYTGRAGERLTIRLGSDRFDTYLVFGRLGEGGFQELASNDDAGGGTDSALEVTLPADGEYGIRAQALAPGGNGPYRLRVEPGR